MHRYLIRRLLAALVAISGASLGLSPAAGAELSIGVTPSLLELSASAGGRGSQQLTVANRGSEPFHVTASAETYRDAAERLSARAEVLPGDEGAGGAAAPESGEEGGSELRFIDPPEEIRLPIRRYVAERLGLLPPPAAAAPR